MTANIPDRKSPEWGHWAIAHPLHKAVVGERPGKAVMVQRIATAVMWISTCRTRPTQVQMAAEEWGIGERAFDNIHADAVREIKAKFTQDRPDFLAQKLEQLEHLVQAGLDSGQLSAAAGAMGLLLRASGLDSPHKQPKR
jgi:hypothetical protein